MNKIARLILFSIALVSVSTHGATFDSGENRNTLLELYTSEGCSSCPPADRWLSRLTTQKELWKTLFPVAFHVDYWDYLGWKDTYSDPNFSLRQYDYQRSAFLSTVYTPGMLKDGREWRNWRWKKDVDTAKSEKTGRLNVTVDTQHLTITFKPLDEATNYIANIALLGMNKTHSILAGENKGRKLTHDFVVIEFRQLPLTAGQPLQHAIDEFNSIKNADAVTAWISLKNDPTPIQVTGGKL